MQYFSLNIKELEDTLILKHIPEPYLSYVSLILLAIEKIYDDRNVISMLDSVDFDITDKKDKFISKTEFSIHDNLSINYKIIINQVDKLTKYQLLEFLSFELNKIYCTSKQTFFRDKDEIIFHSGLYVNKPKSKIEYGRTINSVYNSFQAEIIIKEIFNFSKDQLSDSLYNVQLDLKKSLPKKVVCPRYSNEVALFRKLLENEQIKGIIDTNIRNGNVLVLEDVFNSFLENSSYRELNDKLDDLSKILHKTKKLKVKEISVLNCEIRNILESFTKKCQTN